MEGAHHQVAGQRRPNHQLRRILVPSFPHQDDVRILPQKSSQTCRKGQPNLLIHLSLPNQWKMKFDRIFQGKDTFLISP